MDFLERTEQQLLGKGFAPVEGAVRWYWLAENPILYLVRLTEHNTDAADFAAFAARMGERLAALHCTRLVALSLLVDNSGENDPVDAVETVDTAESADGAFGYEQKLFSVIWHIDPKTGQVRAAKGQPVRLFGIEKLLRAAAKGETPAALPPLQKRPVLTVGIFVLCLLLLLFVQYGGQREAILSAFGLSRAGVRAGQIYRLFTCMFLHSGWMHLAANSVYLFYFGTRAERLFGSGRFLLLYLGAGLCGGLLSLLLGRGGISIGASGAVYGLIGAMLLLTRRHGAAYTGMNYTTMLLLALSGICIGFLEPDVDNWGHIGGLLGGMGIFSLLLWKKPRPNGDNAPDPPQDACG